MPISEVCTRNVIIVDHNATVSQAAKLMKQHKVGALVVVEIVNGRQMPLGIVTDRDFVEKIIATEVDPGAIRVSHIMTSALSNVQGGWSVFETIQYMQSQRVRQLPVVNADVGLIGVVTLDESVEFLADELSALGRLLRSSRNEP